MNTLPLASINGVKIQISNDAEKLVPIKHMCDAIGVNYTTQLEKIKNDDIFGSVVPLRGMTGADGKTYQMACLPLKYVFGWLATINSQNVSEEARPAVIRYKKECYEVLYRYFYEQTEFIQEKEQMVKECYDRVQEAKRLFRNSRNDMYAVEKELHSATHLEYHEWKALKNQMQIDFPESE